MSGANFKFVLLGLAAQSVVAKVFTAFQSRAVCKISCLHRLAPLHFDEPKPQNGCVAAPNKQFILFGEQSCGYAAARAARPTGGPLLTPPLRPRMAAPPPPTRVDPPP